MTREEASRNLRRFKNGLDALSESVLIQSVDMAIEALSVEGGDAEMNETKPKYMQSSPDNGADSISRADVLKVVCDNCNWEQPCGEDKCDEYKDVMRIPSADRPKGEWKEVGSFEDEIGVKTYVLWCQNCGALYRTRRVYTPNVHNEWEYVNSNFCPNCGARMSGQPEIKKRTPLDIPIEYYEEGGK